MPNAELHVVSKCGHWVMIEASGALQPAMPRISWIASEVNGRTSGPPAFSLDTDMSQQSEQEEVVVWRS